MSMAFKWDMKDARMADLQMADLEALLTASTSCCPGLPGWRLHWQISRDPRAKYRVGLLLWMEPDDGPA